MQVQIYDQGGSGKIYYSGKIQGVLDMRLEPHKDRTNYRNYNPTGRLDLVDSRGVPWFLNLGGYQVTIFRHGEIFTTFKSSNRMPGVAYRKLRRRHGDIAGIVGKALEEALSAIKESVGSRSDMFLDYRTSSIVVDGENINGTIKLGKADQSGIDMFGQIGFSENEYQKIYIQFRGRKADYEWGLPNGSRESREVLKDGFGNIYAEILREHGFGKYAHEFQGYLERIPGLVNEELYMRNTYEEYWVKHPYKSVGQG